MMDTTIHLLIAGETQVTQRVASHLASAEPHFRIHQVTSAKEIESALSSQAWNLIITQVELADCTALEIYNKLQTDRIQTPLTLLVEPGNEVLALQYLDQGIEHCLLNSDDALKDIAPKLDKILRIYESDIQRQDSEDRLRESEERYLDIFDNTSDLVQCLGPDGHFLYTNKAWREALGYSESEIAGLTLADILHPDSEVCCQDRFARLKNGETLTKIEFKFISKNGDTLLLAGDCGSIIKNGEAISTRGIFKNVTEEKKSELALITSESRYQSLFQNAPDIDVIIDTSGTIISINKYGANALGYTVEDLIGKSAIDTVHAEDRERVFKQLNQQFENCVADREIEFRKVCKDGSTLWVQMRASLVPELSGQQKNMLIVCRDITETKKLSDQLVYQATHDSLTNLVNRREFEKCLTRMLSDNRQKDEVHALCYLDLDQFKIINDACGHLAGDELLRQVSTVLTGQVRSRDILARLGGDEFAVLMENCSIDQAEQLANRFRKVIEGFRFHWKAQRFSIGVSIGVVPINDSMTTMEQVMSYADSACYAAKNTGRNRVFVYQPDDATVEHHMGEVQWASKISLALEQNRFLLYAQPIYSIDDINKSDSYEILVRLKETSGTIIRPGAFLAAAERFNLSNKLDKWVFENTLHWFTSQPVALNKLTSCSINLSGLSLSDESFLEFVANTLDATGFPCDKLCFEITETAAISNLERANAFIGSLKEKGCSFALDDFGSGLSSYGYLKNLPVDAIKIDGAFIRNIERNEIDRAVVKSICEIASLMDKKITAEYVESKAALEILHQLNVDYVQGNYLAPSLPISLAVLGDHREEGEKFLGNSD